MPQAILDAGTVEAKHRTVFPCHIESLPDVHECTVCVCAYAWTGFQGASTLEVRTPSKSGLAVIQYGVDNKMDSVQYHPFQNLGKTTCQSHPGNAEGVRVHVLLYANDIVILSDNPADLQCALDAAHAWAHSWHFHFAVGPQKTAVMCFGPGRMWDTRPKFRLGNQLVPIVNTYTYLGIVFHENLQWRHPVDHVLARGEARIAACISWTASEDLPVHLTERVFQTYVCPSVYFGLELISQQSQLQRMNRRMFQWGRRLLMWPQGAPTAAVQGQLGWTDTASVQLLLLPAYGRAC